LLANAAAVASTVFDAFSMSSTSLDASTSSLGASGVGGRDREDDRRRRRMNSGGPSSVSASASVCDARWLILFLVSELVGRTKKVSDGACRVASRRALFSKENVTKNENKQTMRRVFLLQRKFSAYRYSYNARGVKQTIQSNPINNR